MPRLFRLQMPRAQQEPLRHQIKAELTAGRAMQMLSRGVSGWAIDSATGEPVDLVALQDRLEAGCCAVTAAPGQLEGYPQ